jgi:hypothetical protein
MTEELIIGRVAKFAEVNVIREVLTGLIRQCDASQTDGICPIIQTLARAWLNPLVD